MAAFIVHFSLIEIIIRDRLLFQNVVLEA